MYHFFELQIAWNTSAGSHQKVLGFANLGLLLMGFWECQSRLKRHPWCQVARYLPLETSARRDALPRNERWVPSVTARCINATKLQNPKEQTNHTISPASHMSPHVTYVTIWRFSSHEATPLAEWCVIKTYKNHGKPPFGKPCTSKNMGRPSELPRPNEPQF